MCQACESANVALKRAVRMTFVVEGFWGQLFLDVFSLPIVEWQEDMYDSLLLCGDRATNWVTAKPT